MICLRCRSPEMEVIKTKHLPNDHIRRRRACLKCGFRFTTDESIVRTKTDKTDETYGLPA